MAGKIITINWQEIAALPSDEYHLKLLNKQQSAMLIALCEYQHWMTRWDDIDISQDELDKFVGDIEYRLMGNEDAMPDPIDTYEAIRMGIYDAFNDLAKQVVSGRTTNIAVGDDGTVSNPATDTPTDELPEDDPETVGDESLEALAGGANAIRLGINKLFSQMDGYFTSGLPVATAKTRIKMLYALNEAEADAFVDYYYTTYALPTNPILMLPALDSYLFCRGISTQSIARYAYDAHTPTTDVATIEMLLPALGAQLNDWFQYGINTPSTDYVDFSCTKTPTEIITVPLDSNVFYSGVQTWKINHRIRFTVSGSTTDPQGDIIDFWWNRSAAGVLTFKSNDVMIRIGTTEQVDADATSNEVPYSTGHAYTWTGVLANTGLMSIRVNRGTGIDTGTNYTWNVTVEDLGEVLT